MGCNDSEQVGIVQFEQKEIKNIIFFLNILNELHIKEKTS